MGDIPVSFEFKGKHYKGFLSPAHGSGAHVYHLMIDKFYYGRLRFANDQWVFDTNGASAGWERLADYFGEIVQAWFG